MKLLPFRSLKPEKGEESCEHQVSRVLLESLDGLYSAAYRVIALADVAEDLVQDTAQKALRAAPKLKNDRNVRAWLFSILFNAIRDYKRRSRLRETEGLDIDPGQILGGSQSSLSWVTVRDVRQALLALSPAGRAVIILVDLEQFTIAEAAEILKLPAGTVASRLFRAHEQLRRLLTSYESRVSG
jgi:RNA polymerase sigma-70 factor (ECF subfamily)